jgi:CheY-like chemotaxis protein
MSPAPHRPRPVPPSEQTSDAAASGNVLIVDDHEISRRLCAAYCDLLNFSCELAASGAEAIEAMRRSRFDLVLMDIQMPGMSGVETVRIIRAMTGPAGQVPIIAVTSEADPQDRQVYNAIGMDDVVPKPISVGRLFRAITDALGLRQGEPRSWAPDKAV